MSIDGYREKDPDPDGKQLAATKDPLGEATKLVQQLKQYAGERIKTHLLAFEVGSSCRLCRSYPCNTLCAEPQDIASTASFCVTAIC